MSNEFAPPSPARGRQTASPSSGRSSSQASSSPSLAQMQRTMPRMTDSTTGPGGPSSLKFAALSVDSYQLDSPPFIGTAVGSDGLLPDQEENQDQDLDAHTPGDTPSVQATTSSSPEPKPKLPPKPNADVTALNLDEAEEDRPLYSSFHNDVDAMEDSTSVVTGEDEVDADLEAVERPVPVQAETAANYRFPKHRLPQRMHDESKTPLVIVACGSFSPPTYLHLRIFEMAKDAILENGQYELLAGYYSPVSDHYKKAGLAPSKHRVRMCELAVEKTSTWLMVDAWESLQDEYQRTAVVLDHFDECLNRGPHRGILLQDGTRKPVRIMLLAGGDLIQSMGEPGVWAESDLKHILGLFGCLIIERTGADVSSFLLSHDLLWAFRKHLLVIKQTIYNDISSSKVRLFIKRAMSVKYLLPNSVINYINQHRLYRLSEPSTESPQ